MKELCFQSLLENILHPISAVFQIWIMITLSDLSIVFLNAVVLAPAQAHQHFRMLFFFFLDKVV